MLYKIENGTPVPAGAIYIAEGGTRHNTGALDAVWTDADLQKIGLYRAERQEPAFLPGQQVIGWELVFEGGKVWEVAVLSAPKGPPDATDVAQERDRRLDGDFEFQGVMYKRDPKSIVRISGAAQMATRAIGMGAQPGDLFWHGGDDPFGWIASDDSATPMDAQTVELFGIAMAARETQLIFAARALRRMDPIPEDFADDKWWP
jgi:hypothetical protein